MINKYLPRYLHYNLQASYNFLMLLSLLLGGGLWIFYTTVTVKYVGRHLVISLQAVDELFDDDTCI